VTLRGDEPMPRVLAEALKPFVDEALCLQRLGCLRNYGSIDPVLSGGFKQSVWRALLAAFEGVK
jgi:hypothetical protein